MGSVVVNSQDKVIYQGSKCFFAQSALQAKTIDVQDTLVLAIEKGILHVTINLDCLPAILQIGNRVTTRLHQLTQIVDEIHAMLVNFHCCSPSYSPRALNKRAHKLAYKAKRQRLCNKILFTFVKISK